MNVEAIVDILNDHPKSMKKFQKWYEDTHPGTFDEFLRLPEYAIIGVAKQFVQETNPELTAELWAGPKAHPSEDIFNFVVAAFKKLNSEGSPSSASPKSNKKSRKGH